MIRRHPRAAFTLLEVLMMLGLLGLLSGVFIASTQSLLADRPLAPEDVFWKTVNAARKQALLGGSDWMLTFARAERDEPAALVITSRATGQTQRETFEGMGELTIDFLSTSKSRSSILVGGQLVETQTMPSVTFYADGTCTPFRTQVRTPKGARILEIDPWTCAPVLPVGDNATTARR